MKSKLLSLVAILTLATMPVLADEKKAEETKGEDLSGIGVVIMVKDAEEKDPDVHITKEHPLLIKSLLDNTPAVKSGLKMNDQITAIDGIPTEGMHLPDIAMKIRGKEGTSVKLTIVREDEGKKVQKDFSITRAHIKSEG